MSIPPGRPGNLSSEQDAKLRELWAALFRVFGISPTSGPEVTGDVVAGAEDDGPDDSPDGIGNSNGNVPEKKRKRHLGIFGRKSHKEHDAAVPAKSDSASIASSSVMTTDADDKYGQTKQFKQALASQTPDELRTAFWSMVKMDNPDALLLRFLRARKWDVEKALVMLISTLHWRLHEVHVDDDVIKLGDAGALEASQSADRATEKEAEGFLAQLRMGKSFIHGTDLEGRPICLVRVRLHRQGEQSESSLERYTVYVIETTRLLLTSTVDTADYTPLKFMIKCFEANYPESLGIWTIVKGWLDPVVASKVHFTKHTDDLAHYIAKSQILAELGGDEPWSYQYIEPAAGENARMADGAARDQLLATRMELVGRYERATWSRLRLLDATASAEQVEQVERERRELAEALRENYWAADPYLRARSWLDRTGVIRPGGAVHFYDR
ncbi:MAG: hypothetical protein M1826_006360 [Phylliscum demangeonii]|nr:MAG: hypothetical protein M1826_006360 [Phylliscum demangeonii]